MLRRYEKSSAAPPRSEAPAEPEPASAARPDPPRADAPQAAPRPLRVGREGLDPGHLAPVRNAVDALREAQLHGSGEEVARARENAAAAVDEALGSPAFSATEREQLERFRTAVDGGSRPAIGKAMAAVRKAMPSYEPAPEPLALRGEVRVYLERLRAFEAKTGERPRFTPIYRRLATAIAPGAEMRLSPVQAGHARAALAAVDGEGAGRTAAIFKALERLAASI